MNFVVSYGRCIYYRLFSICGSAPMRQVGNPLIGNSTNFEVVLAYIPADREISDLPHVP
jgi:hypothetical protein